MVWPFRRRRFKDVVRRQLMLFAGEHQQVVEEARIALRAYGDETDPTDAQERYARYDDLAEDVEDLLYEMCDGFASNMSPGLEPEYIREFDRQARATYGDLIPRLKFERGRRRRRLREGEDDQPPLGPIER